MNDNDDIAVIVSHSNAIIALIHYWLKLLPEMFHVSFDIEPCSITYLRGNEWSERTIFKLNDTSHLDNGLVHRHIYNKKNEGIIAPSSLVHSTAPSLAAAPADCGSL